jgi:hypothetical protein
MRKPTKDTMPTLPEPAIADRGIVRFASVAASELQPLNLPAPDVADRGVVRLGSTGITFER